MSNTNPTRHQILLEADQLICSDRNEQYGEPIDNLGRIASYWSTYLGRPISARDVALMMVLSKVAREANGHKPDSCVDMAGYAAIAAEVEELSA
ncbi:DUF6378 domain-containing protein [Nocardia sp. NPDC058058]|uniref:DUF6378 domain-containing protein n=1 Tax=Nocardia sp. NPDC058058 TaxID=3346317 RepID=UPI0036DF94A4